MIMIVIPLHEDEAITSVNQCCKKSHDGRDNVDTHIINTSHDPQTLFH